jgi:putative ABC transport system permease protein
MLGLIFGVGAVIAAVSLTNGAREATLKRFEMMGTSTLTVRPGQDPRVPVRGGIGTRNNLTLDDAQAILKNVHEITAVAPQVSGRAQVESGNANTNTQIIGTTESSQEAESYHMDQGSFFTGDDVEANRKVAVLGPTVTTTLFGKDAQVVGRRIRIKNSTFKVIGQFRSRGGMGFRDPDDQILIPITTAVQQVVGAPPGSTQGRQTVNAITAKLTGMAASERAQAAIVELLRERHKTKKGDPDDVNIMAVADVIRGAQEANKILTLLFTSIAAISLVVGGIGIMNIMLVSVTERTREIGLRKAVGASPKDILVQFLIEAVTLSMSGGAIGVLAGIGATPLVTKFGLNAKVPFHWVIIAFSFAALVGVVFGLLPARKAAALDPVEALRYE